MYKAVIFDLDDTLYEYEKLNEEAISVLRQYTCMRYQIIPSYFDMAFGHARKETKTMLVHTGASHNRLLYCQKTLERLGEKPVGGALDMYEVYWGYILKHMKLRDGVLDLLEYCSKIGIKIGICSDLTAHIQHRKLRKLGIDSWIDAVVTSEEAGAEKPAEIMYKLILNKLGVAPEHAIFVGDSLEKDVEGAQKVGIRTVWLHAENGSNWETASSFREVKEIIHVSQQN